MMNKLSVLLLVVFSTSVMAQSLKDRVIPNDPSKYKLYTAIHGGAGTMGLVPLITAKDMTTNFLYLHSGVIHPKSSIGHHFHNTIEEMFVLLTGEAEFTVNGRTSKIKAPAMVPCTMGNSHAIYNPSDQNVRWLNFGVSTIKGKGKILTLAIPALALR